MSGRFLGGFLQVFRYVQRRLFEVEKTHDKPIKELYKLIKTN